MKKTSCFALTILLVLCCFFGCTSNLAPNATKAPGIYPYMLHISGEDYYGYEKLYFADPEIEVLGYITATVPISEAPTQNDQGNFLPVEDGKINYPYGKYEGHYVLKCDPIWPDGWLVFYTQEEWNNK